MPSCGSAERRVYGSDDGRPGDKDAEERQYHQTRCGGGGSGSSRFCDGGTVLLHPYGAMAGPLDAAPASCAGDVRTHS